MRSLLWLLLVATLPAPGESALSLLLTSFSNGVYRVDPSSGARTLLALPQSQHADAVAYDVINNRVLWSERFQRTRPARYHIAASSLDTPVYSSVVNTTKPVYSLVYDAQTSTLIYNSFSDVTALSLTSMKETVIRKGIYGSSQLSYDNKNRVLYFADKRSFTLSRVGVDGSAYTVLHTFPKPAEGSITGIAVTPSGDTVYMCRSSYNNKAWETLFYAFDQTSRSVKELLRVEGNMVCKRLLTDGASLFVLDNMNNNVAWAPLNQLTSLRVLAKDFTGPGDLVLADLVEALKTTAAPTQHPSLKTSLTTAPVHQPRTTTVQASTWTVPLTRGTSSSQDSKATPSVRQPVTTTVEAWKTPVPPTRDTPTPQPSSATTVQHHQATTAVVRETTSATRRPCRQQDFNPLCPRFAAGGLCGQLDVIKYCKKSCLC